MTKKLLVLALRNFGFESFDFRNTVLVSEFRVPGSGLRDPGLRV